MSHPQRISLIAAVFTAVFPYLLVAIPDDQPAEEPFPQLRADRDDSAIPFEYGLFPRSTENPNKPAWQVISRRMYAIGTPAVRWLDDDRRIVVESATWSSRVFDTKTWETVELLPALGKGHKTSAAQSPDGRWIVTADSNRHRLYFHSWNGKHGATGTLSSPSRLNWDPTSRRLVAVESNRRITIWLANGEKELDLGEIPSIVCTTAWSPNGNQLAASNFDGMVYVWKLPSVRPIEFKTEHVGGTPRGLSHEVSVDTGKKYPFLRWASEDTLTSQSSSGAITLWSKDGKKKHIIERPERCTPQWSPDGQALAIQVGFRMEICSPDGTKVRNTIELPQSYGRFAWSQDSQRLAILAWPRQLLVWDVWKEDQPVQVASAAAEDLGLIVRRPIQWTPDGKRLTCGSRDPAIRIWNSNGTPANSWATPGRWTHDLSLLPSGKQLASRSWPEQEIRIWELDGMETTLETKVDLFAPAARDGNHVASSADGSRRLVQTRDGVRVYGPENTQGVELSGQCLEPGSATWSPDGAKIACPTQFNTVIVWDATTGQVEWVGLPLENAKSATVAADGRLSTDDRDAFDTRYCFVMKDAEGKTVFLNSREFEAILDRR